MMKKTRLLLYATIVMSAIHAARARAQIPGILNYQGRVAVGEVNFDGGGLFKFAMVNADGTTSYWSNDGTSSAGSEPTAAVAVNVRRGIYSVLLGDTSVPNMSTIPASVFNNMDVRLRVWFNDGTKGWQRLSPDQRIAAVGYAMTAGNVPDGSISAAKIAEGAVTSEKLAPGSALANLNTSGQAGIPDGGLILSATENQALVDAGYVKVGTTLLSNASPSARAGHSAVWTGTEMIIWGGVSTGYLNDGARYDPVKKTWHSMSKINAPSMRSGHFADWTGTEMIIWGGSDANNSLRSGARYNPTTDTWTPITTSGSPSLRSGSTAIWTGTELIVWGGTSLPGGPKLNTGARYNPSTNTWGAITTSGAPTARVGHSAVWTGSEMIIYGGGDTTNPRVNNGARYNPLNNTWTSFAGANAPYAIGHKAVWTGSTMIIWRGTGGPGFGDYGQLPIYIYNFALNAWTMVDAADAPDVTSDFGMAWTGSKVMVFGGVNSSTGSYSDQGYIFNPGNNTWSNINQSSSLGFRSKLSLLNVGGKMIVWGGYYDVFGFYEDGACYNPDTNAWDEISSSTFLYLYQKP